ncbi:unnamed protein product, partial [Prorocentrum cordatum]
RWRGRLRGPAQPGEPPAAAPAVLARAAADGVAQPLKGQPAACWQPRCRGSAAGPAVRVGVLGPRASRNAGARVGASRARGALARARPAAPARRRAGRRRRQALRSLAEAEEREQKARAAGSVASDTSPRGRPRGGPLSAPLLSAAAPAGGRPEGGGLLRRPLSLKRPPAVLEA